MDRDVLEYLSAVGEEPAGYDAKPHRRLRVWQAAMELAETVYRVTDHFPAQERYGLASQMQRAAVSVPSNIAEGAGRATVAEFLHFLHAARGSLAELDTQIEIAWRREYLTADSREALRALVEEVARTLQGLIAHQRGAKR